MSQSTEKRARRAWRNRMKATAGSDWEKAVADIKDLELMIEGYEATFIKQRRIIIALSILSAALAGVIVWGVL